MTSWPGLFDL